MAAPKEWIGPDHRFEEKVDQFFHRLEQYGGAMHTGYRSQYDVLCPDEGMEFVKQQYARFNVPVPPGAEFLYTYGVAAMVDIIDYLDPYLMFWSFSDVRITTDWSEFKYQLMQNGKVAHECAPDELETFVHQPGTAEAFFNAHMNMPGLASFPPELSSSIETYHSEIICGDRALGSWNEEQNMDIQIYQLMGVLGNHCVLPSGLVDQEWMHAYFDLALWAGALWFFGPLGRDWRCRISDVTSVCLEYGECILYAGDVYDPGSYRKHDALAGSCQECGVGAWCVETVALSAGWTVDACERCATRGMPNLGFGTCGTRVCRYAQCPHNPFHNEGTAGVYSAHRAHGQLAARADERRRIDGVDPLKKGGLLSQG